MPRPPDGYAFAVAARCPGRSAPTLFTPPRAYAELRSGARAAGGSRIDLQQLASRGRQLAVALVDVAPVARRRCAHQLQFAVGEVAFGGEFQPGDVFTASAFAPALLDELVACSSKARRDVVEAEAHLRWRSREQVLQ